MCMSLKWYLLRCSQVYEGFGAALPFDIKEVTMSPFQEYLHEITESPASDFLLSLNAGSLLCISPP